MTKIKSVENFWKRRMLQQNEKVAKSTIVDKLRIEMLHTIIHPTKVAEVAWVGTDQ